MITVAYWNKVACGEAIDFSSDCVLKNITINGRSHFPATTASRKWKRKAITTWITDGWETEISEVSPRVTPVWWVYGGHRPSGPPARVQTATAGTVVLSWHGPRPPRFRYHHPNGWRALPTSWGSPASRSSVPWSTPPSTNVPVSHSLPLSYFAFPFESISDCKTENAEYSEPYYSALKSNTCASRWDIHASQGCLAPTCARNRIRRPGRVVLLQARRIYIYILIRVYSM